ncbi:MAG: prepilin-type N-terminal cleavage/methylation domain-containing protein [Planctomycetota bacterium]|jgi:prepilin-type N-terminal cleavage/methylation domain-containing protein
MRRTIQRHGPSRGFTLVEVLLVIVIMSMMFVSISKLMQAARRTRDTIHNYQEMQLAGPAVLELMSRDLRGIFTTSRPRTAWLSVVDRTVNGQDADRLDFATTTDSLVVMLSGGEQSLRADINEVGYMLRPNPDNDEFLEIYRREDFGVDEEPFEGGEYTFLSDQIKDFNIEVFSEDGPDAEPYDGWGLQSGNEELVGLPAWMRLSLTVELKPRIDRESMDFSGKDRRTMTYYRVVRFPETLRVEEGEIPRLGLPAAPGATATETGAGGEEEVVPGSGITATGGRGQTNVKGGAGGSRGGGSVNQTVDRDG